MHVGRLSLGTANLGMPYGIANENRALSGGAVTSILQAAVDLGITGLDTAPEYGVAEQRLGAFLDEHDLLSEISVCTKLPALGALEPGGVVRLVEERLTGSLHRLRCECIDCYLIHDVEDLRRHGDVLVDALVQQRKKGRVLDIGVSVYEPAELELVAAHPELDVVQHPYNLLDRRLQDQGWADRLRSAGTKVQIRSVLLQGLLAMRPDSIPAQLREARAAVAALREVLAELGLRLPEAAVAFALALDADRVIVAANSADQLEALTAASSLRLPDELYDLLGEKLGELPATVVDPRNWPESR